jgi:carboxymethylenebutenolidase
MNKAFLGLALLFISTYYMAIAQDGITICHTPTTEKFAMMASQDEFMALHEAPLPYVHYSENGEMVRFPAPDGMEAQGYLIRSAQPSNQWVFVFQEWWGLNDHIKREAEKLYNDLGNVNVLALDMYDGKVGTTAQEASALIRSADRNRLENIIKGAQQFVGKEARIGTIGWCFGGMWSLQAAILLGEQNNACVVYYGTPEQDIERLKLLNTDVLGIFAARERNINPEVVAQFEKNMKAAGKELQVYSYDAEHAFANPSNPNFDEKATTEAYGHTMSYLRNKFKQ